MRRNTTCWRRGCSASGCRLSTAIPFRCRPRHLDSLEFHPAVTFIIGDNGTGKSTLLEAIAVAWGFNAEGGTKNFNFATRETHSDLHDCLRLVRSPRQCRDGFFLRAESYYNVASNIDDLAKDELFGVSIHESYGGASLHKRSHGESFFAAVMHRFGGKGLYLLDEPEAALSPLTRMHDLIGDHSQFIIATHSPIVMAYPNARILQLTDAGIEEVDYRETEHFRVTRDFLMNQEKMLEILLAGDG
jgi:predicted ATPase